MSFSRRITTAACCIVAVLLAGCGSHPELMAVSGTLKAAGKPLGNVLITFIPIDAGHYAAVRSMAVTSADGTFVLATENQLPGAVVGKHRVVLEDLDALAAPRLEDGTVLVSAPSRFAAAYANLSQSTLTVDVSPNETRVMYFDWDVAK